MRFDNKERESSVSLYITYLNQVSDLCTLTFTHVPAVSKVKNNSTCVLRITKPNSYTRLSLYVFVCVVELCQSVLEGLVQKNHVTQLLRTPDSVVQAVVRQGERLCAESDPRKGGYPAGY